MKMQGKTKKIALAGLGVALAGSIAGGTLIANAQSSGGSTQTPTPNATPAPQRPGPGGPRTGPPGHGPFKGAPGRHRGPGGPGGPGSFPNLLGGEHRHKGADGKVHTAATIPGTVVSVSGSKVTVNPNDGSANKEFTFDTANAPRVARLLGALKAGDQVIVTTLDGAAKMIVKVPSQADIQKKRDEAKQRMDEMRKKIEERRSQRPSGPPARQTPAPTARPNA